MNIRDTHGGVWWGTIFIIYYQVMDIMNMYILMLHVAHCKFCWNKNCRFFAKLFYYRKGINFCGILIFANVFFFFLISRKKVKLIFAGFRRNMPKTQKNRKNPCGSRRFKFNSLEMHPITSYLSHPVRSWLRSRWKFLWSRPKDGSSGWLR